MLLQWPLGPIEKTVERTQTTANKTYQEPPLSHPLTLPGRQTAGRQQDTPRRAPDVHTQALWGLGFRAQGLGFGV